MAERSRAHRVLIEDTREDGQYLRVTWHRDARQFVLSHWRDDTCVAATRIDPAAAADLVRLLADGLADGLADAATARPSRERPPEQRASPAGRRERWRALVDALRRAGSDASATMSPTVQEPWPQSDDFRRRRSDRPA
jgi:hypothetical protein